MSVTIKASGTSEITLPPERGTVTASIGFEGPEAGPVYASVVAAADGVRVRIEELQAQGAVTRFAFDQVSRRAERPWHQDGVVLPLVHSAAVSVSVTFQDFDALGEWLGWGAEVDGLAVRGVEWTLTREHQQSVERDARQAAVRDARAKAQDYADALGLGPVRVKQISDAGFEGLHESRTSFLSLKAADSGGSLELTPEHVRVTAQVQGVFVARPETGQIDPATVADAGAAPDAVDLDPDLGRT